jgi:sugar phosphate isomerase/epimerase
MRTRTGNFAIGFRKGRTDWQRDIGSLCSWAKTNGFESLDLNSASPADIASVIKSGLQLGTVDLIEIGKIADVDPGKRKALLEKNLAHIEASVAAGAKIFFTVIGGEATRKRAENYKAAVEAFSPLAEAAADRGAVIAFEGYPGAVPDYALLCTTPETVRAMLKDIPRGMAINYDPSHLIRLGVDHVRFLSEFVAQVVHVHAKDTELFPEAIYELGLYQPSAFRQAHGFGQHAWRYTLPGHGAARWPEIFKTLLASKYQGVVSVELEDENFNGSEGGEKAGLIHSRNYLAGA